MVLEDGVAADLVQPIELHAQLLVLGRNAGIADLTARAKNGRPHAHEGLLTVSKGKPFVQGAAGPVWWLLASILGAFLSLFKPSFIIFTFNSLVIKILPL